MKSLDIDLEEHKYEKVSEEKQDEILDVIKHFKINITLGNR
jgi:hypothetical protein